MARNQQWQDDYWLPLMQLYLKKPVGVKPVYCKAMVDFAMEIHIAPQILFNKMCEIANAETPRIEHIWQEYGKNPRRLKRAVTLWHQMRGFGNEHFFEGVDVQETFERDFRPVSADSRITPVMLVLILDQYFRLTPITMVAETPGDTATGKSDKVTRPGYCEHHGAFTALRPLPQTEGHTRLVH